MKTATLFMVPATIGIFADAAEYFAGSKFAGLAVWFLAAWLFAFLLSRWWAPRS